MDGKAQRRRAGRPALAALAAGLLMVLFVAGLTLANSIGASRVAENAATLHWLNGVGAGTSLARAALAQEVTFVGLESRGLAELADVEFARAQTDRALAGLAGLHGGMEALQGLLTEFTLGVTEVRSGLLGTEYPMEAMTGLEAVYQDLSARLVVEQEAVLVAIAANTEAAARIDDYLSALLTLAIPAAAVLVYWLIARRQVREHAERGRIELEAERALGRAKDAFISGLSHELRTPLTSVYGFAEILSEGAHDSEQVGEMASEIARESAELARMVDDLIVASRLDSTGVTVEVGPTALTPVVESAMHPFVRAGFVFDWSPTPLIVETDGQRLRQVLVNLLSNAVRHGGPNAGVAASVRGDRVEIDVWDDGEGLTNEMVERLDEHKFAHDGQTTLITGSVGLGLSVGRRLVERLGGSIRYRHAAGRTSFIVSLPEVGAEPEIFEPGRSHELTPTAVR